MAATSIYSNTPSGLFSEKKEMMYYGKEDQENIVPNIRYKVVDDGRPGSSKALLALTTPVRPPKRRETIVGSTTSKAGTTATTPRRLAKRKSRLSQLPTKLALVSEPKNDLTPTPSATHTKVETIDLTMAEEGHQPPVCKKREESKHPEETPVTTNVPFPITPRSEQEEARTEARPVRCTLPLPSPLPGNTETTMSLGAKQQEQTRQNDTVPEEDVQEEEEVVDQAKLKELQQKYLQRRWGWGSGLLSFLVISVELAIVVCLFAVLVPWLMSATDGSSTESSFLSPIQLLAGQAQDILSQQNGAYQCGESQTSTLSEEELSERLRDQCLHMIPFGQFEAIFSRLKDAVQSNAFDGLSINTQGHFGTSFVSMSMTCTLSQLFWQPEVLLPLIAATGLCLWISRRRRR